MLKVYFGLVTTLNFLKYVRIVSKIHAFVVECRADLYAFSARSFFENVYCILGVSFDIFSLAFLPFILWKYHDKY